MIEKERTEQFFFFSVERKGIFSQVKKIEVSNCVKDCFCSNKRETNLIKSIVFFQEVLTQLGHILAVIIVGTSTEEVDSN